MFLDHDEEYFKHIRAILSVTVIPIQYLVETPTHIINWVDNSFATMQTLQADNAHLRVQVLLLQSQLQKLLSLENENAQLRELLQSYPKTSDSVLVAQLLSVDSDPFKQELIVNQGKQANVYLGQPVLDATGVLGQVIEVDPYSSRVLLLTDTRSAIPIQDNRNGVRGILYGTGDANYLQLKNLTENTDIQVGDVLMTSGLDGHFPAGYPVGTVKQVLRETGHEFSTIIVQPTGHLNRSRLVLLIWPHDNTAQQENTALNSVAKEFQQQMDNKKKIAKDKKHHAH